MGAIMKYAMVLCGFSALCTVSAADTIYLQNGVHVDGVVVSQSSDHIRVRIGNRESVFRASEIQKIEKNDRTGGIDLEKLKAQAVEREKEMQQRTGLTAEQRVRVSQLLGMLVGQNEDDRAQARRELLDLAKQEDLFRYFEVWLPSMLPRFIPGVLEILCEINPVRARPLVLSQIDHPDALTRAAAIRCLGELRDKGSVEIIARGLLDHDPEVRIAAAYAFGLMQHKEATPLLLSAWSDPDLRVQKTCKESLMWIWSTPENIVNYDTVADWESFWMSKSGSVRSSLDLAKLKPLVEPGTLFYDE